MNNITVDSEFQSLIPPLSEDEFARLEKSVIAEGVRDPIITWGGVIVDGHNRFTICQEHGIDCPSREREFGNRDEAKLFIIGNQLQRRNLPPAAIGILKLAEKDIVAAQAKERMLSGKAQDPRPNLAQGQAGGKTLEILARDIPIGRESLRKLDMIDRKAREGDQTAIEAREALMSGEKKSIHGAYVSVVGRPKPRKSSEVVTDDGRRICNMCGEPINPGEEHACRPNVHRRCQEDYQLDWVRDKRAQAKRPVEKQRCEYNDADRSLRENVPTFTTKSLLAELHASAERLQSSWAQSFEINESMGVKLKASKKKRLEKIAADLIATIEKYQGEENGD